MTTKRSSGWLAPSDKALGQGPSGRLGVGEAAGYHLAGQPGGQALGELEPIDGCNGHPRVRSIDSPGAFERARRSCSGVTPGSRVTVRSSMAATSCPRSAAARPSQRLPADATAQPCTSPSSRPVTRPWGPAARRKRMAQSMKRSVASPRSSAMRSSASRSMSSPESPLPRRRPATTCGVQVGCVSSR
jgi:hypothetical protein